MKLDVLGLLGACSYALDCVEAELLHNNISHASIEQNLSHLGMHCSLGEKNLQGLPFHTDVTNVILYHHENADRSGPFGKTWTEVYFVPL